jgi:hypothetical protein
MARVLRPKMTKLLGRGRPAALASNGLQVPTNDVVQSRPFPSRDLSGPGGKLGINRDGYIHKTHYKCTRITCPAVVLDESSATCASPSKGMATSAASASFSDAIR